MFEMAKRFRLGVALAMLASFGVAAASAQTYPARPVTVGAFIR